MRPGSPDDVCAGGRGTRGAPQVQAADRPGRRLKVSTELPATRTDHAQNDLITRQEHAEVIRIVATEQNEARAEVERLRTLLRRLYDELPREPRFDNLARDVKAEAWK